MQGGHTAQFSDLHEGLVIHANNGIRAGEIACGYADGCLNLKQTILLAYHRGRMAPDHGVKGGLMAAVGLSAEAAESRLKHAGLMRSVVGCDNSATGVTLAGWTALSVR